MHLKINALGKFVEITVGSFFDKDAYLADKQSGKIHTFNFPFADLSTADKLKLKDFEDVLEAMIITQVNDARGNTNELEAGTLEVEE